MITDLSQLPERARGEFQRDDFERTMAAWGQEGQVCPRDGCADFTPVRLAGDNRELRLCIACERLYEVVSGGSSRGRTHG